MPRLSIAPLLLLPLLMPVQMQASPPSLDWLAGHWCGVDATRQTEEHWLPPANGALLGMARTLADGRMVDFEYLRIVEQAGTLAYLAQPGGRPATAFTLADSGPGWVRFENLAHDFPTRIEYRREDDRLAAEIAGPDGKGGERRMRFAFRSCSAAPSH